MLTWLLGLCGCAPPVKGVKQESSALQFKVKSIRGEAVDLAKYEGKVVLVVNVASNCGYTGQYEGLQAIYEKHRDRGLAILGFPCNQFWGQEPGSAEEIQSFCKLNYGVTFDLFEKVDVNGESAHPFFQLLTSLDTQPKGAGPIGWNFEKFLISRDGKVVGRFKTAVAPEDEKFVGAIKTELEKK